MKSRLKAVAFDVIGTLFDLEPLDSRLMAAGLPRVSTQLWLARLLRDAFALETSGDYKPFQEIASAALQVLMTEGGIGVDDTKVGEVIAAFAELPAYRDVEPALKMLRDANIQIAALTNGSEKTTRRMFENAGLDHYVGKVISIDEVRHWKPAREVYLHAAKVLGVAPEELALVAAHDWDTQGARAAGLISAGVTRKPFSSAMPPPHISGDNLVGIIAALLSPA